MPKRSLTNETALYLAVFLLAFALRVINLGAFPLSEYEASWAMQAFDLAHGEQLTLGAQPFYTVFTSLLFTIAGSSEFAARLLPLIAGLILVCIPYFYRDQLGPKAAVLLTFGLAVDPTLVGLSRIAGSSIVAVAFSLAALTAWMRRAPQLTGVFVALALLSGPTFLAGVLSIALTWALAHYLVPDFEYPFPSNDQFAWRPFVISLASVLLIAGTFFLRIPQGLSALGLTLPSYFSGWWEPNGVSLIQIWFALVAYQALPLVFAALAIWRAWARPEDHLERWLALWLFSALLLTLSYPSRHPADLIWALIPLWFLAARFIAQYLRWHPEDGFTAWGQAALTSLLLTFLLMNALRLSAAPGSSNILTSFSLFGRLVVINQQTVSLASIIALGVLSTALIGAGWSPLAAARGLVWGSAAVLFAYTLSTAWKPVQSPHSPARELWSHSPGPGNLTYLSELIGDFSEFSSGMRTGIDIVSTYESAILRWELRHFPEVTFLTTFSEEQSPAVIITGLITDQPRLSAPYRGQAIPLFETALWDQMSSSNWQRWLLFRDLPTENTQVILWIRSDVFPEDYSFLEGQNTSPEWIAP